MLPSSYCHCLMSYKVYRIELSSGSYFLYLISYADIGETITLKSNIQGRINTHSTHSLLSSVRKPGKQTWRDAKAKNVQKNQPK